MTAAWRLSFVGRDRPQLPSRSGPRPPPPSIAQRPSSTGNGLRPYSPRQLQLGGWGKSRLPPMCVKPLAYPSVLAQPACLVPWSPGASLYAAATVLTPSSPVLSAALFSSPVACACIRPPVCARAAQQPEERRRYIFLGMDFSSVPAATGIYTAIFGRTHRIITTTSRYRLHYII